MGLFLVLAGTALGLRLTSSHEASVGEVPGIDTFLLGIKERERESRTKSYPRRTDVPKVLKDFDPNTADSATFRSLGLPAFIAHNIVSYRAKGGVFRTPEAFSKIYGLTAEQFSELRPYIYIADRFQKKEQTLATASHRDTSFVPKYPEGTVVDLNRADTAELKRIPGIGSGIARMIVSYRERLGGFYSVEQIDEIDALGSEAKKWFEVTSPVLRKLEVNKAGLDKLRNHPYMDFYKAKAIVEYRRKRGKIKSLSRLSLFEEFTEKDLEKLSPYLSFE